MKHKHIIIGYGKYGPITKPYENAKSCQFCVYFRGIGFHAWEADCVKLHNRMWFMDYRKTANKCPSFVCKDSLVVEDETTDSDDVND